MCGINGVSSKEENRHVLNRTIEDMFALVYRGRHSHGVSWLVRGSSRLVRFVKLGPPDARVREVVDGVVTSAAIAHVRFASVGAITIENAQPFTSEDGSIALVHNGHLSNYARLRAMLEGEHTFKGTTDSEVILHLFEDVWDGDILVDSLVEALEKCDRQLQGMRNYILFLSDGTMIAHADNALSFRTTPNTVVIASTPTTRGKDWKRLKLHEYLIVRDGKVLKRGGLPLPLIERWKFWKYGRNSRDSPQTQTYERRSTSKIVQEKPMEERSKVATEEGRLNSLGKKGRYVWMGSPRRWVFIEDKSREGGEKYG